MTPLPAPPHARQVEEHNTVRMRMTAEIADSSNMVKLLVIRAEDARQLGDMCGPQRPHHPPSRPTAAHVRMHARTLTPPHVSRSQMKKIYADLFALNNELVGEFAKRATNHKQLLEALKAVNGAIQKAARLRNGAAKTRVVSACRAAVKQSNFPLLFQVMKQGRSVG